MSVFPVHSKVKLQALARKNRGVGDGRKSLDALLRELQPVPGRQVFIRPPPLDWPVRCLVCPWRGTFEGMGAGGCCPECDSWDLSREVA